jgi:hypothetical protein
MGFLNIGDIKEGMIVEESIINRQGQVILNKDVILSQRYISVLKSWGISEVKVKGVSKSDLEHEIMQKLTRQEIEDINERIVGLYSKSKVNNPVMEEMKRLTKRILFNEVLRNKQIG